MDCSGNQHGFRNLNQRSNRLNQELTAPRRFLNTRLNDSAAKSSWIKKKAHIIQLRCQLLRVQFTRDVWMTWSNAGITLTEENRNAQSRNPSQCHCVYFKPHTTGLQLQPGLPGYGPATNILSHRTVQNDTGKSLPVTCHAGRAGEQTNSPTHYTSQNCSKQLNDINYIIYKNSTIIKTNTSHIGN